MTDKVAQIAAKRADIRRGIWHEWALIVLAAVNGLSGVDGHKPEHYVAGAVFFVGYCLMFAVRAHLEQFQ